MRIGVASMLVVVLEIEVGNLLAFNTESESPVAGHMQAPESSPVASQAMGLPDPKRPQLIRILHIL